MPTQIYPLRFGINRCYLVQDDGIIMIDGGPPNKSIAFQKLIKHLPINANDIRLIILTHGDFDHCGNAAYLRNKFSTQIAMNKDDSGMVEHGDMLWNRNKQNFLIRIFFRLFFRLSKSDRFKPDLRIDKGYDVSGYGFDAKVLDIPGHSKGSIGILTASNDLFCGDLLVNTDKPAKNTLIDDSVELDTSVEKLKTLKIKTVYPGHGKPFQMEQFIENKR